MKEVSPSGGACMFVYFFKPNIHWNVITENQYNILSKFYDSSWLKKEIVYDS